MKIFNSLTNKKEEFIPLKKGEVSMYVCGPTVYNYIHIGNARPVVVFDTLRRVFEQQGNKVMFISNYTDVDDKIIKAAQEAGLNESDIAKKYIEAYEKDRQSLNTIMPDYRPRVTEYMPQIIAFIADLVEKGYAYEVNGDVYFRVSKIKDYGKLANLNIEDLQVGARIEENEAKENPLDFTLWKQTDQGINWESPWSVGRPGWHTECVVMIAAINQGEMIDIHGGGMDLKFPHHTNEIAQAEGCFNHSIARYWMHNGFINIDDEKMSKSLGNVKWTKDVVAAIGSNVFRIAMMSTHYRAPLNFSEELIETSKKQIEKLTSALKQAQLILALANYQSDDLNDELFKQYMDYMEDDLNTPNALKVVYDTMKVLNQETRKKEKDLALIAATKNSLERMLSILGVFIELSKISSEDIVTYENWLAAKENKDFTKADKYREILIEKGIL